MSWLNLSRSEELLGFTPHCDYKDNESSFGEYCSGLVQAEQVHHSTSRAYTTSMRTSIGH